jgi:hypothetical protein
MEELTGFQSKVTMRSFIVVLFKLELVTLDELAVIRSKSWGYEFITNAI